MPLFNDIRIDIKQDLEETLKKLDPNFQSYRILRMSIDARKKRSGKIYEVYSVETFASPVPPQAEREILEKIPDEDRKNFDVTIIGAGPAGLFTALRLVERGIPCRILERGKPILQRMRDISRHWKTGEIHPDSNVCFGEGGAGTFSDGKLITRVKSEWIDYVMQSFVRFGAPDEILYLANPHVGSNRIRKVIHELSQFLQENGCPIHYEERVEDFEVKDGQIQSITTQKGTKYESTQFILATGHSAHDTFRELIAKGIEAEAKPYAMGFRIEHPQSFINQTQYGSLWEHPKLPVANYKITHHDHEKNIGVYSFCMCPGGYVLASSAQNDQMVVNGMSNYGHGSRFANSGIVFSINDEKYLGKTALESLAFQSEMEKNAFSLVKDARASKELPVQTVQDFINNKVGKALKTSSPSGVVPVNLRNIFPEELNESFLGALEKFERKIPGFIKDGAQLYGIESRTSSPIRIPRDKDSFTSPSAKNLYPIGEGPGYAGGITSAAADGVRIAEAIYQLRPQ